MPNLLKQVATSPFLDSITETRYGYCKCGCGAETPLYKRNNLRKRLVKGTPHAYLKSHDKRLPIRDRFWSHVLVPNSDEKLCWLYMGHTNRQGYGTFSVGGDEHYAHRVAWEINFGAIPAGMFVLHSCDNPQCVRPSHLFVGTADDNMKDMMAKGRQCRGENAYTNKLTVAQVLEIRVLFPKMMRKEIAEKYGISPRQVLSIGRREQWRHIP